MKSMKFTYFAPAALAFATVTLAACSGGTEEAAAPAVDEVALELSDARLMLPAVSGNPGAIYFPSPIGASAITRSAAPMSPAPAAQNSTHRCRWMAK